MTASWPEQPRERNFSLPGLGLLRRQEPIQKLAGNRDNPASKNREI
jgi:hypothetical protein